MQFSFSFLLLTLIICNCYNGHLVSREKPVRIYGRANTLSQLVWNWCLIFTSCFLIIQQLSPSQKSVLDYNILFCSLCASTITVQCLFHQLEILLSLCKRKFEQQSLKHLLTLLSFSVRFLAARGSHSAFRFLEGRSDLIAVRLTFSCFSSDKFAFLGKFSEETPQSLLSCKELVWGMVPTQWEFSLRR